MLKEIATRLGLQIILVTHEEDLLECADRTFRVTQSKRRSEVEVVSV